MDNASFRIAFSEFASTTIYTDTQVTQAGTLAEQLVDDERWGDMRTDAVHLQAAHILTIRKAEIAGGGAGGGGPVSSEAVGSVSVSYDISAIAAAGQMAETSYGRRYLQLARLICAGGSFV